MAKSPPLEKTVVKNILNWLNAQDGVRARKIHGGQYGGGWPDIICSAWGSAVFIEVKRPGAAYKPPTELQQAELDAWRAEGSAEVFVATSVDDVEQEFLERCLM